MPNDPTRPPAPRPTAEYVDHPDGTREDVSKFTERQLTLRAINETVSLRSEVSAYGKQSNLHATRIQRLEERQDETDERVSALESANVIGALPPMRDQASSSHEWNEILNTAGQELSRRVKDKRDPMNSDRARALASDVFEAAKKDEKYKKLLADETASIELRHDITKSVITWAVIGMLTMLATAIGTIVWTFVRTQAVHDQGVADERSRHANDAPLSSPASSPAAAPAPSVSVPFLPAPSYTTPRR